jgi:hypothetical protein
MIDEMIQYKNFQNTISCIDKCTLAELKILKDYIDKEIKNV